jgi:uncharacterized protein YllA (UPF0747 family)
MKIQEQLCHGNIFLPGFSRALRTHHPDGGGSVRFWVVAQFLQDYGAKFQTTFISIFAAART